MWSYVCPMHNVTASKLMEESAIEGFLSHYSICPSQLMYQMKNVWPKASVLYEQLLSSVPYVCLCSLYTEKSINCFVQKLTFSFKVLASKIIFSRF